MTTLKRKAALFSLVALPYLAQAGLDVNVGKPHPFGQKALIKVNMRNTLAEEIESARAVMFLMDGRGRVVGQATRWVIGGSKRTHRLSPGGTNTYEFVVSTREASTNLAAKIQFNRLILQGGKSADVANEVKVTYNPK
jgi:hypothetical protein